MNRYCTGRKGVLWERFHLHRPGAGGCVARARRRGRHHAPREGYAVRESCRRDPVDRNDVSAVQTALNGARFDVVYDNVYDWERGTTAEQVSAAAVAVSQGLRRYVFTSSVAALEDGLRETYQWYRQQQRAEPDFSWEDRLLVAAR